MTVSNEQSPPLNAEPPVTVMTPFGDRVVVKIEAAVTQTASKLHLPQGARVNRAAPLMADVIDCGPDCRWVEPRTKVLIAALADGVEVQIPGQGYLRIVGESAVIACLTPQRPLDIIIAERDRLNDQITERLVDRVKA